MSKPALRKAMRRLRRGLPAEERVAETRAVTERLLALDLEGPVFLFVSVRAELDTSPLIAALRTRTAIAIPRILDDGRMEAAHYEEPLIDGPFGVPTSTGPVIEPATVLVPGLAFDAGGGRLGYGGGFYDRWMAAHPRVRRIGIGFGCQLVQEVPREPHDVLLHEVVCGFA